MLENRILKFRQFDGKNFHYWGQIKEGVFVSPLSSANSYCLKSDQFTERYDKNGDEIYDNDFISCYDKSGEKVYDIKVDFYDFRKQIWSEVDEKGRCYQVEVIRGTLK